MEISTLSLNGMKLLPVLALALLAACAGPQGSSPSASTLPSAEAIPTASPEATDSPQPSASPTDGAVLDGFDYTAILRIEVDNLAVRTAPFTSSPRGHRIPRRQRDRRSAPQCRRLRER